LIDQAFVSVVVPHYEALDDLARCLTALAGQTFPSDRFEIIVADNRSPCGSDAVRAVAASSAPGHARVIDAPVRGAGPARNAGVAASRGALLAFTDCDCVPEPGWLAAGILALSSADIAGGGMAVSVSDEKRLSGAEAFERVFAFNNRRYVEDEKFTVTANLFCSRAVFDAVGPFLTGVSEDVEWCHRAAGRGFTLAYAADAIVSHPARRNWRELKRKWERINAERFALAVQAPRGRMRWAAQTAMLPLSILAHAPRVVRSGALTQRQSRWRALGTLARLRCWRTADALSLLFRGTRT
jgi:GT2 family glycosyltransferase